MRQPRLNALFLLLAAIGLFALNHWGPGGLYTFDGHGRELSDLLHLGLWLLFLTHLMLLVIMWTQRDRWDAAEAAIFRFIGAKGLFWIDQALTIPNRNGISLPVAFLLVLIVATTSDLDAQLIRRYVIRRRELP